jgi:hypothetical protein
VIGSHAPESTCGQQRKQNQGWWSHIRKGIDGREATWKGGLGLSAAISTCPRDFRVPIARQKAPADKRRKLGVISRNATLAGLFPGLFWSILGQGCFLAVPAPFSDGLPLGAGISGFPLSPAFLRGLYNLRQLSIVVRGRETR